MRQRESRRRIEQPGKVKRKEREKEKGYLLDKGDRRQL